ncbi:hypothetical protein [Chitinophaga sp.]|uniref:hypothetical protein n=1 Tax=Chitinophaga sp. TaxID=1869181 RepID=UPI0031DE27D7
MNATQLTLWEKIEQFPIDDGAATLPFSARLAKEQCWTAKFTQRAILEYKRFIFLCCVLDNGASPSKIVDEVWHLHLTYTRSYWEAFCRDTLGTDLHHIPSTGGHEEDNRHLEWYKATLTHYKTFFDSDPPDDIWPPPGIQVPKLPPVKPSFYKHAGWIFCLPFLIIYISYHQLNPYLLNGPHFLFFFPVFAGALLAISILYQFYRKKDYEQIAARHLPLDANAYQLAAFLFGKNRAVQTAIINLLNRDLLALNADETFRIKRMDATPLPAEDNPLMGGWEEELKPKEVNYEDIVEYWYDPNKTFHPALHALERFVFTGRFVYWIPYIFFMLIGVIRCIQGAMNDRPFINLICEMILASIIYWICVRLIPDRKKVIFDQVVKFYKPKDIPMSYALNGPSTLQYFTDAALLTAAFGASITEIYRDENKEIFPGNGDGGGSGCSGGGCGGGCGGCGGGGD